jgi:tetratricopeptide (TPR) repeat protein
LHGQVEQTRYFYGDDLLSSHTLRAVEAQCRNAWATRDRLLGGEAREADTEEQLMRDLLDAAVLWAHCHVRLARASEAERARGEALHVLDEAEALCGPSPALNRERESLGVVPAGPAAATPPHTAWDHYTLGRWLLLEGEVGRAAEAFDRAVELRPQDFWPWYGKGVCAHRRKRHDEAVLAFTVCVALSPGSAACYHNRGLARAAAGDVAGAQRDCERALQIDPGLTAASQHRDWLRSQEHPPRPQPR